MRQLRYRFLGKEYTAQRLYDNHPIAWLHEEIDSLKLGDSMTITLHCKGYTLTRIQ